MGNYGLQFWLPQVIHDTLTTKPLLIGWISVIPWGSAAIGMVLAGHINDVIRAKTVDGDPNAPYFAELERLTAEQWRRSG